MRKEGSSQMLRRARGRPFDFEGYMSFSSVMWVFVQLKNVIIVAVVARKLGYTERQIGIYPTTRTEEDWVEVYDSSPNGFLR